MPVHVTCLACGRPFFVKPYRAKTARFCSIRCGKVKPCGPIEIDGDGVTARIPLRSKGGSIRAYALIDADMAAWAGQYRWFLHQGYASRKATIGGHEITIRLHRDLLGLAYGDKMTGDHIDHRRKLDNRRCNLRPIPKGAQAQNVPGNAGTSSKYRGVCWSKSAGKWRAYANVNGKPKSFGHFASEEDAAAAARAARLIHMPYATE